MHPTTRPLPTWARILSALALTVAFLAGGVSAAAAEPGDPDHPTGDPCAPQPDAPWCSGPSLRECPGGAEVPETDPCPGNGDAIGDPSPWAGLPRGVDPYTDADREARCDAVNADPSGFVRCDRLGEAGCTVGYCWSADEGRLAALAVVDELPATGPDRFVVLALLGAMATVAGVGILRRTR